ncbi:MAG: ABC transporter permease subunit [Roseiflexaceae bacterium]|nr:ABC transporter permease subunit [Roseiflexaceae bacterium]
MNRLRLLGQKHVRVQFSTAAALLAPLLLVLLAMLFIPLVVLAAMGLRGADGALTLDNYLAVLVNPRYRNGLLTSIGLASAVTTATLVASTTLAYTVVRDQPPATALIRALLTFPLSFPGIVVGFMTIILFGRTGALPALTQQLVGVPLLQIAYTLPGLFVAYLYFEIPRITLALAEAIEQVDARYEAAARTLGARPVQVFVLVLLPLLRSALISSSALAFATSMGAFGTAYTLAQRITILPIQIYDAYTVSFEFELASAMAVVLGLITMVALGVYRAAVGSAYQQQEQ